MTAIQDTIEEIKNYHEGFLEITAKKPSEGTSGGKYRYLLKLFNWLWEFIFYLIQIGVVAVLTILFTAFGLAGGIGLIVLHKKRKITVPFLRLFIK